MTTVNSGASDPRPGLAIGGGVLAGIFTLALVTGGLWLSGRSADGAVPDETNQFGRAVAAIELSPGDCIDYNVGASRVSLYTTRSCDGPHIAEVTAKIDHPDSGSAYPGADAMLDWSQGQCGDESEAYLGLPLLMTTLTDDTLLPDFDAWSDGDNQATCVLLRSDSTSLTSSVSGAGSEYPRGEQVVVSRLIAGDCFTPANDVGSYLLNSNSLVDLTDCESDHNGVFFGRGALDTPIGTLFPGEDEVGAATSQQCGQLFEEHYGVASDGFNYRYWRPNQRSWDLDDRTILCAVLDSNPMSEPFDPSSHEQFFDLAVGQCFNLAPEETSESLRLDDQVRVIPCSEPHVGQMIGSGNLEQGLAEPFPADNGVLQLAGAECEVLFVDFVGVSPYQSELGNFPFWYPNEPGWDDGDRRYACAFLEDEPRSETLEGAEAAES